MPETPSEDLFSVSEDTAADGSRLAPPPSISLSKLWWSVALSLLVLFVVGYFTFELDEFRQTVDRLNLWMLAAAVGTLVPRVVFGGERLRYVSRGRLSFMAGIRGQLAWDFFSNVTPSAIGGGPVATFYVARDHNIPVGEATAILLFSMLLDQLWFAVTIPVLLVTSYYLEIFPASLGPVGTWAFISVFLGMLVWVFVFGYAVLYRPDLLQRMTDWIFRIRWLQRFRGRVAGEMDQLRRRAKVLRSQPPAFFAKGFLLTACIWISRYLLPVFIVWSVYADFDKLLLMLRTAAMSFGTIVLPTPGGAGGMEGLYALFLGPLMPKALVAPTLLMWRLLGYYLFLAIGVYLSMHQVRKTIRRRRDDALREHGAASDHLAAAPEPEAVDNRN